MRTIPMIAKDVVSTLQGRMVAACAIRRGWPDSASWPATDSASNVRTGTNRTRKVRSATGRT
ncbi:hypothetical protein CcI49_09440 [Frankia sp. CcI49]|nr:hypothetical protein CcI49_09440 [Frankia sp. CcI49]